MAQKKLWKLYPKIEGGSKFGFGRLSFVPSDTRQADPVEGAVEYDDSADTLVVYDGSTWNELGAADTAGTGLDGAYDLNKTITVDGATVTLAGENADVLTVTQSADDDNIIITKTGTGGGNLIKFTNAGSGDDIQGTSDTWSVEKTGVAKFTTVTGTDLAMTGTQLITADDTSGTAVTINLDTLTSGKGLLLDMNAASTATLLDILVGSTHVFTVDDAGEVAIAGVAKNTDGLVVTAGDITITDGDLDLSSGQFSLITDGAGDGMTLTDKTGAVNYDLLYLNGSTNAGDSHILSIAQGAGLRTGHAIDITMGTTAVAMSAIDIDCSGGTRTVPVMAVDSDGTASDFIYLTNGVIFTGNYINMAQTAGAATGNFIYINNDSGTSMEAINIDDEANVADTILIDTAANIGAGKAQLHLIQSAGTPNATSNGILVDWTAATNSTAYLAKIDASGKTFGALTIDSDNTAYPTVLINCGGALTDGLGVLNLTNDGELATGGNLLNVTMGAAPADETACAVEIVAAQDCQALAVATSAATASGIVFTGSGATANDTAVFEVNWGSSTPANAGANLVRIDGSDATMTNKPVLCEILDNSTSIGLSVTTASTEDMVLLTSQGATANSYAALKITNSGNLAAGGALLNMTLAGSPDADARVFEIDGGSKDAIAMYIDSDAATDSAVQILGAGTVATDKAMLSVTNTGTLANGSALVRIDSGANATATAYALEINASHDNIEGLWVNSGVVLIDETLEVTAGATITADAGIGNWKVEAVTASVAGATSIISDDVNCVQITSTDANHWLVLPTPTPGAQVWLISHASTACELRSSDPTNIYMNNVKGAGTELVIDADSTYLATCLNATDWIVTKFDNVGAPTGGGTPDTSA